ncbi:MAG: DUF2795 domain-containing protein [Bacteroidaceae bacterium]|nr:DUF2795 domain-containing protein [Bacteroidaceae bacterium]
MNQAMWAKRTGAPSNVLISLQELPTERFWNMATKKASIGFLLK